MKRCIRGLRFLGVAAVMAFVLPLGGIGSEPAAAQDKQPSISDLLAQRIDFQVQAEPSDPFDTSREVGADPKRPLKVRPGQTFRLIVHGTPKGDFYTFAMNPPGPGMSRFLQPRLLFKQPEGEPLRPLAPLTESPPQQRKFENETAFVHSKPFSWAQDVLVMPTAKPGMHTLDVPVRLMACNDRDCVGPGEYPTLKVSVEVAGEPVALSPRLAKRLAGGGKVEVPPQKDKKQPDKAGPGQVKLPRMGTNSERLPKLVNLSFKVEPAEGKAEPGKPVQVRPGQLVRVTITGTPLKAENPKAGMNYTYPILPKEGVPPIKMTRLEYLQPEGGKLVALPPVAESPPQEKKDLDGKPFYAHTKPFTWSQDVLVAPDAGPGPQPLYVVVRMMVCNESTCTDPAIVYPPFQTTIEVTGDAVKLNDGLQKRLDEAQRLAAKQKDDVPPDIKPPSDRKEGDLGHLLFGAFIGAFLMLLTPCVFPMIPITVNFFIKQSEREHHRPLVMASVYSGTIVVLLTVVMISLGSVVIALATNAWFNLFMGALLVFFALSLFGMFELQLPAALARFTSAREGQGGYVGAFFMALTFTITSFTCTGPFLGLMMGGIASVQPPLHYLLLAALVYSITFSAPFFVLALFPSVLKKLPKSGSWMNAIKVTMAFVEVAAALKFLSRADVDWNPGNPLLFNYDTVLCAWIILAVAAGLYLFGLYRLPHDHDGAEHVGVVRMMFAVGFLGLAVYMTPALFGVKPAGVVGENLMAFLPQSFRTVSDRGEELEWHLQYEDAWAEAVAKNVPILVDFTGVSCENCRYNEQNIFPDKRVRKLMKGFARAQLYVDVVPDRNISRAEAKKLAEEYAIMRDYLGNPTNPSYYLIWPDRKSAYTTVKDKHGNDIKVINGKVLASYLDGKVVDVKDFIKFLQTVPPEAPKPAEQVARVAPALPWHQDFEPAWKEARERKVPMLIEFAAWSDENGVFNEQRVFPLKVVQKGLENYARVRLYTDVLPDDRLPRDQAKAMAARNVLWRDALGDPTVPGYFVFVPGETAFTQDGLLNGEVLAKLGGKIANPDDFVRLLETPRPAVVRAD
jgi:thiol:disulfide interchange protein DsbD